MTTSTEERNKAGKEITREITEEITGEIAGEISVVERRIGNRGARIDTRQV